MLSSAADFTPAKKTVVIGAGYLVALLVACGAVAARMALTFGPEAQASSGMYAFGDVIVFVGTFGMCALVPTGLALWFVRANRRFWNALTVSVLAVASTGLAATVLFMLGRTETGTLLAAWSAFSVLRILIAPLFALTFLVCACFAPGRSSRFAFLSGMVLEAAVAIYGGVIWFLPLLIDRLR